MIVTGKQVYFKWRKVNSAHMGGHMHTHIVV